MIGLTTELSPAPVILVGMHRSGTSLLSRLLKAIDVHVGADCRPATCESLFFRRQNVRVLQSAGASWFRPGPIRSALADPDWRARCRRRLARSCRSRSRRSFLGRDAAGLPVAWGWKDPRSTLTLPLWLELFPDARVIEIVRHGVDVAASLVHRERSMRQPRWGRRLLAASLRRLKGSSGEYKPFRFSGLGEAFELWAEYQDFAESSRAAVAPDRWHAICFERLLDSPGEHLERLFEFLQLGVSAPRVSELAAGINADRAFAFRSDPDLLDFYAEYRWHPWMARHGYDRWSATGSVDRRAA